VVKAQKGLLESYLAMHLKGSGELWLQSRYLSHKDDVKDFDTQVEK
jgi:hypothetical protein